VRLQVRGLTLGSATGRGRLVDVDLDVRSGEIVGVAGVAGNGQAELCDVLTGMRSADAGTMLLDGIDMSRSSVRALFERGVAHIPEDRNEMGVVGAMRVAENLVLRRHRQPPFARGRWVDWRAVGRYAHEAVQSYEISAPSVDAVTRQLSGGNVQKVILARELSGTPGLVVASHPTYGLDVSATELTHRLLRERRDEGAAVLLVSEDLDELLDLADTIVVLDRGSVAGVIDAEGATRETIGALMTGASAVESVASDGRPRGTGVPS